MINTRPTLIAKVRRGLSLAASTTTALSLLLSGAAFTATAANAVETPLPEINAGVEFGDSPANTATDRFIVKFSGTAKGNPGERGKAYGKVANQMGVSVKELDKTTDGAQVVSANRMMSAKEVSDFVSSMKNQANVEYAEPDALMQVTGTPNDTLYPKQWHLFESKGGINVPGVWDKTTGTGQVVAVIDTGITAHSDLSANVLPGYDMINDVGFARDGNGRDANPQDEGDYRQSGDCNSTSTSNSSWHGTHVAGTIAALTNNSTGVAGVAPDTKILPVRVLGACGGYNSDIAAGIIWASGDFVSGVPTNPNPARTINLSVGGPPACSVTMQNAVDKAVAKGSVVVVSAGNSNVDASTFAPASCDNVITVAATNREGQKASYSNYGAVVDIAAPGGDGTYGGVASTFNAGTTTVGTEAYGYMAGTSMSAPHVSGISALMLAADPSLTPAQVESRMKSTARPLLGTCTEGCGAGIVDASAAVIFPVAQAEPEPAPAPAETTQPAPAPIVVTISPVSSSTPTISGTVQVGRNLTADPGTWGPEGVELSYQWNVAGTAVNGANASTYAVQPGDAGKTITVTVTGTKDGYLTKSETSENTVPVEEGTLVSATPAVSGTAKVGETLTATSGAWGPSEVTLAYQWNSAGVPVSGATNSTYEVQASDLGKTITVTVTGSKTGYAGESKTSSATTAVAKGSLATTPTTISGTVKAGYTLTANHDAWGPAPVEISYRWLRDGVVISGANAKTYTLTGSDTGKKITAHVIGRKDGYTALYRPSLTTAAVAYGDLQGEFPKITGTAKVNYTLTANPGLWTAGTTVSYQWYRDGVAISGGTGKYFKLTEADRGHQIKVRVLGKKTGYTSRAYYSYSTAAIS